MVTIIVSDIVVWVYNQLETHQSHRKLEEFINRCRLKYYTIAQETFRQTHPLPNSMYAFISQPPLVHVITNRSVYYRSTSTCYFLRILTKKQKQKKKTCYFLRTVTVPLQSMYLNRPSKIGLTPSINWTSQGSYEPEPPSITSNPV